MLSTRYSLLEFSALQECDARKYLALEEFEAGTAAGGAMSDFVHDLALFGRRGGITTADHGHRTGFGGLRKRCGHGFRAFRKFLHFEHPGRSIPNDRLGSTDDLRKKLARLWTSIEAHPAI